jgi:predicted Zn-dependent protease
MIPQEQYVSAEDEAYGHQVLAELSREHPLSREDAAIDRVRTLVMRLAKAAHADQNPWNVFVLQGDNVVNAAATRGNYVFVWTGMLRTAQSDGELATVISHELGHVLANHTHATPQEEAGEIMARTSGNIAGQIVASQPGYGPLAQLTGILVTELVKAVAVNPEAQRLETEADQIGFFLMADAGYDPHEALSLWSKMANSPDTAGGALQFLSSHPASADRLEALQTLLPEAVARYERARRGSSPSRSRREKRNEKTSSSAPPQTNAPSPDPYQDSFAIQ